MTFTYSPLAQRRLLSLHGPDSMTFLQGQTTCDVEPVSAELSVCGACCTPQGRLLVDFRLLQRGSDDYLLALDSSIADNTVAVLGKYIVFSKAEIQTAPDWQIIGLQGAGCEAFVSSYFGHCPGQANEQVARGGAIAVRLAGPELRVECYLDSDTAEPFVSQLQAAAQALPEQAWQAGEINAGQAHVEQATLDLFLPQMLNYQATGLISFTKGCYTGQEIVARMHYRGKLKRRLYRASVVTEAEVTAAMGLYSAGKEQSIGNIANAVRHDGQVELLAVISNDATAEDVHLGSPNGPVLVLGELPYSLEQE